MKLNADKIKELTTFLVHHKSVVGTPGEKTMMEILQNLLLENPYFKTHPTYLSHSKSTGEFTSLLAMVKGEEEENPKTVILLGHLDTVGVEDYGALEDLATQPQQLMKAIESLTLDNEIKEDLYSGDYMFGRGALDMKSGVAIMIHILETLIQHRNSFSGQVVCLFVNDEEASSKGMLSGVPLLLKLKENHHLDYQCALDTDYTSERTLGDPNRYLYAGTVGKLMPSFFIVGKETHVGDPFAGLDPNEIAARILHKINLNLDLCDVVDEEVTVPPISLRFQDQKKEYSVQTAKTTALYFNYATHHSTPKQVMTKLEPLALEAFQDVVDKLNRSYETFTEKMNLPYKKLPWTSRIYTYDELYTKVRKDVKNLDGILEDYTTKLMDEGSLDQREISLALTQKLHSLWSDQDPIIILYFSPPYYPHMAVKGENKKEQNLLQALKMIENPKATHPVVLRKFYPYISDLSYFSLPREDAMDALQKNMPGFGTSYQLPLDEIRALDLPVANIGPYGYDAHQFTERLLMPYSFEQVPSMVLETTLTLLKP